MLQLLLGSYLNLKTEDMLNSLTLDFNEFQSEFYPQISSETTISPNLSQLETIFPFVSTTSPAPDPMTTVVGAIGQNLGQQSGGYVGNLVNGLLEGLSPTITEQIGNVGSTAVNSTIKVWFSKNWAYVALGFTFLFGGIWYFAKKGKKTTYFKKRY